MSQRADKTSAEIVAEYVIEECSRIHGAAWLGSRTPTAPSSIPYSEFGIPNTEFRIPNTEFTERIAERLKAYHVTSLRDLVSKFQLKGVREDSRQGLLGWLENRYPLILMYHPPTPDQLLDLQCDGQRVVTLHREDTGPIGRHAGPFEFLLHDLEHAHKFFGNGTFQGQVRFFKLLRDGIRAGLFTELMADSKFRIELEYLMADMNSHPLHLLKYLKAIVLEALPGKHVADLDRFFDELFGIWALPEPVREAARKINYPALENNEARLRVSDFFAYN